jgi:hypothetical protein
MYVEWAAAFGVVAALVTIIRLITGPQAGPRPELDDDYGLLRPVASVETLGRAAEIRRTLSHGGVRATTSIGLDGRVVVLVFEDDYDRARKLTERSLP